MELHVELDDGHLQSCLYVDEYSITFYHFLYCSFFSIASQLLECVRVFRVFHEWGFCSNPVVNFGSWHVGIIAFEDHI